MTPVEPFETLERNPNGSKETVLSSAVWNLYWSKQLVGPGLRNVTNQANESPEKRVKNPFAENPKGSLHECSSK